MGTSTSTRAVGWRCATSAMLDATRCEGAPDSVSAIAIQPARQPSTPTKSTGRKYRSRGRRSVHDAGLRLRAREILDAQVLLRSARQRDRSLRLAAGAADLDRHVGLERIGGVPDLEPRSAMGAAVLLVPACRLRWGRGHESTVQEPRPRGR